MAEVILFPDAEDVVPDFLRPRLRSRLSDDTIETVGRVPSPRPKSFVVIRVVGGADRDLVSEDVTFSVEGWASTDTAASKLCNVAVAELRAAGRDGWLGAVAVRALTVIGRPQLLPDPVSGQTRYTATCSLTWRGRAA